MLLPFEAKKILSIPINHRREEDELCWGLNGDGIFRVKDMYDFASNIKIHASCSSGPENGLG